MPEYRRPHAPGGTFFLTLVTWNREPLFSEPDNIAQLRRALAATRRERPFSFVAGVVLPDHLHFLWTLPPEDTDVSSRVGRFKVMFTRALRGPGALPTSVSRSRIKHHESDVWQRRFWEHTIRDEQDFEDHLAYIHYNPVKHQVATCPHEWAHSSFHRWVQRGGYPTNWCCSCDGRTASAPNLADLATMAGE